MGEVTPITNDAEIETIEQAAATPYDSVNQHISKALAHYADLKNPDYENSVKEAISAVEAMCCVITGTSGRQATLGKAIKKLEESGIHIHGAMEKDLSLYMAMLQMKMESAMAERISKVSRQKMQSLC